MNTKPTIFVVTPVRNEAWVLDAFLTCTSSWADHIIVADQHSDDGSREIAAKYEKVILVDNDLAEMNQAAARELLFREVDKFEGDKIVMALDADEFLSKDFDKTEGWNRILQSKPNEIFCFKWINLYGDFEHTIANTGYMEWGCHFSPDIMIAEEYRNCEKRAVHEMRLPCLPTTRATYIMIPDIQFVHLARLNLARQRNKEDFYQVSSVAKLQKRMSAVSLFRYYRHPNPDTVRLPEEVELYAKDDRVDVRSLVKSGDIGQYYIEEIKSIFQKDGFKKYLMLDIWGNPCLVQAGINPKIPLKYRMLHSYLRRTMLKSEKGIIKFIDRILKVFF